MTKIDRRALLKLLGAGAVTIASVGLVPNLITYKPSARLRAIAERMRIRNQPLPASWPMREIRQYSISNDWYYWRHDIAYLIPATGEEYQLAVEFTTAAPPSEASLVHHREISRVALGRMVQQKCGFAAMRKSKYFKLYMPPGGRWV